MIEDLPTIDGIVAILARQNPDLQSDDLEAFRTAICEHYGGDKHWIPRPTSANDLTHQVADLLGICTEREIARRTGATKSSVHRIKMRLLRKR